jgi:hypothetical protein
MKTLVKVLILFYILTIVIKINALRNNENYVENTRQLEQSRIQKKSGFF